MKSQTEVGVGGTLTRIFACGFIGSMMFLGAELILLQFIDPKGPLLVALAVGMPLTGLGLGYELGYRWTR